MRQCIIHDTISLMTNDYMQTRYNKEIIPRIVPYIITPNTLLYIHLDKTAYLIINKHRETKPHDKALLIMIDYILDNQLYI